MYRSSLSDRLLPQKMRSEYRSSLRAQIHIRRSLFVPVEFVAPDPDPKNELPLPDVLSLPDSARKTHSRFRRRLPSPSPRQKTSSCIRRC